MKDFESLSLKYIDGSLSILNQRQLPHNRAWVEVKNPQDMVECIKTLQVRVPLIAHCACLSLADFALKGAKYQDYQQAYTQLRESRPTAVNLMNALDQLKIAAKGDQYDIEEIVRVTEELILADVTQCVSMARHGSAIVSNGDQILTHCNTGGLATVGKGTALGVIAQAFEDGKNIHVYVDETRPLLQGGRLTSWELSELKIPYTLICDNMAASFMKANKVDKIFVGADRIAVNGDFANKIGTYNLAVLAQYHKIPFYVVAPRATIDLDCKSGDDIPIEYRDPMEVRGEPSGKLIWAPKDAQVSNPAFDVTPASLVSGWVLETGVYDYNDVKDNCLK